MNIRALRPLLRQTGQERREWTYRRKLTPFALAAAIALIAIACDGCDGSSQAASAGSPEPSWVTRFLDPLTDAQAVGNLFEVEADRGQYWRISTLDRFDGVWTSTNPDGSEGGVRLSAPAILPQPGDDPPPVSYTLNQTFRILNDVDGTHALPMAQTAEEVAGPIGEITWDPVRSEAFIDGDLRSGMEYTVRSRIVVPTPAELDRVDHLAPRTYRQWTELPADLDPRIGEITERWTADATSGYRKVMAIQQRFHDGSFNYDTAVEAAVDVEGLLEFLTQTRAGYCAHYSSAMAVMVRTLGLPARIAVGYRSGTQQEDGSYLVQTDDVHVWVEVLFPGYGWLPFEPEPITILPNAQPGTYLNP